MNNLGKNLKLLLSKENISENELSRRVGIPQQMINRLIQGTNLNPKLTTVLPLANYFDISLQSFIHDDLNQISVTSKTNIPAKIPLLEIAVIQLIGIEDAIAKASHFISMDMNKNKNYFALEMYDESMEPKFPMGSILIFEKDREPYTGDFCLLKSEDNQYLFRQVMINNESKKFIKCLNPTSSDFTLIPLPINLYVLATLLEARTNFLTR